MVNIGGKGHGDGLSNPLLKETAELALGVDRRPESRHSEVVLGSKGGDSLLGDSAHNALRGLSRKGHVDTSLHLVGQAPPVGSVQSTLSLQLNAGSPVLRLISGDIRKSSIGALGQAGALPDTLKAERKSGRNSLEVVSNKDTGKTTLEARGVVSLHGGTEIGAGVFVLELGHLLGRPKLKLGLGNSSIAPPPVESSRESAIVVDASLAKNLSPLVR